MISAWKNSSKEEVIFITERVTGGSLRTYVNRLGPDQSLKIRVIRNWAVQILEGLGYLHGLRPPLIHRDLKLDNLLIHAYGDVIIGDLGLSSWLPGGGVGPGGGGGGGPGGPGGGPGGPDEVGSAGNPHPAQTPGAALPKLNQSVVGTPEFMAPELYTERYGTAVDIYSFGLCLAELATRQPPWAECSTTLEVSWMGGMQHDVGGKLEQLFVVNMS